VQKLKRKPTKGEKTTLKLRWVVYPNLNGDKKTGKKVKKNKRGETGVQSKKALHISRRGKGWLNSLLILCPKKSNRKEK